jgi:hypothetical protein
MHTLGKAVNLFQDFVLQTLDPDRGMGPQEFQKPFLAEHLILIVGCLGNAIGINDQDINCSISPDAARKR